MKIVDLTEFYSERGGGIRSHLTTRGTWLSSLGHEHVVIAPGPTDTTGSAGHACDRAPPLDPPARQTGVNGSRVVRIAGSALPYDRTYHLLTRFDKLGTALRVERPDVLEAHSPYLAAAGAVWLGKGVARTTTAFWHSDHVAAYLEPAVARIFGGRAARGAGTRIRQGLGGLLAPFDATFVAGRRQADILRSAGVSPVFCVPFGADVATFRPEATSGERRRELLDGAGPDAALLVGVGRFALEKRWDVVLEAFSRVRARRNAVLVLFGDGPERARLQARAPAGVRFRGFEADRARLASALASADVLVHGCPCETYGIGIVEAVASGLPVVVPDEGGASDAADPACAEAYRSLDAEACAAAVERLLDRNAFDLRSRANIAARRVRTAEQHVRAVLSVYGDLLRR